MLALVRGFLAVSLAIGFLSSCGPKATLQRIESVPLRPTQGGVGHASGSCRYVANQLELLLTATCVVNREQRIVVTDLQDGRLIRDTKSPPELELPNFPVSPNVVPIYLPIAPADAQRALRVQFEGDCEGEHAAGSTVCRADQSSEK